MSETRSWFYSVVSRKGGARFDDPVRHHLVAPWQQHAMFPLWERKQGMKPVFAFVAQVHTRMLETPHTYAYCPVVNYMYIFQLAEESQIKAISSYEF